MKTRTEQLEFIQKNCIALSACAWQGYEANGRGVVCVLVDDHNASTRTVPYSFLPEYEASELIKEWNESKEARLVAEYNPAKEAVILFVITKGDRTDFDCYRIQPQAAPPIAAES